MNTHLLIAYIVGAIAILFLFSTKTKHNWGGSFKGFMIGLFWILEVIAIVYLFFRMIPLIHSDLKLFAILIFVAIIPFLKGGAAIIEFKNLPFVGLTMSIIWIALHMPPIKEILIVAGIWVAVFIIALILKSKNK